MYGSTASLTPGLALVAELGPTVAELGPAMVELGPAMVELGQAAGLFPVLQATGRFENVTQVLLLLYELVGAVLGLFISYQAYRGYRRNDSRPMFFISAGFILIVGVPVFLIVPFLLVPSLPQVAVQVASQTFEILGLVCIIYALRANPER